MAFKIDKKGRWINPTLEGHCFDRKLALALVRYLKRKERNYVVDLGCGPGWYVKIMREKGLKAEGFDGNPYTEEISKQLLGKNQGCKRIDLSKKVRFDNNFDAVISLEVGEHIPIRYEQSYFYNITKNAIHNIILSWAVEGQGGNGHVNCRNNDYVIGQMQRLGFSFDKKNSTYLRARADLPWFKNTVMVFDRIIIDKP